MKVAGAFVNEKKKTMITQTKIENIFLLVKSLSKSEKRYFKLYANFQTGDKVYITLFNLCDKLNSPEEVITTFQQKYAKKSLEMAMKYLYGTLTDSLVRVKERHDIQQKIFNHISKASILVEKNLFNNAFFELDKAKRLASLFEFNVLLFHIRQQELIYQGMQNFEGMTERKLINKQMKLSELLKQIRSTHQHHQLYDILKHRILYKDLVRSDNQKKHLNDLVLSEYHLMGNSSYKGFEAIKLHLLFQANYYLHAGNYKSAIRSYQEVITLFEENNYLILNPPIYYLNAINGILDSLHTMGLYEEMPFFIQKLIDIEQGEYAIEFLMKVKCLIYLYKSFCLQNTGKFEKALQWLEDNKATFIEKIELVEPILQLNVYLQMTTLYLYTEQIPLARKSMKKIVSFGKAFYMLPSYKTVRLVNLILQTELGNYDFVETEIQAIKRNIQHEKQAYQTEKLVFKYIQNSQLPVYGNTHQRIWKQLQKYIIAISQSKYERNILRDFNFVAWIESKFLKTPLKEIIYQNH